MVLVSFICIYCCVSEAVRISKPAATDYDMEDALKKWLRNAKDLDGGRQERRDKKKEEVAPSPRKKARCETATSAAPAATD